MKKNMLAVSVAALALAACGGNKAANNQSANVSAPTGNAAAAPATNQVAAAPAGGITPQEVRAMIARDGGTATVRTLNEGGSEASPNRLAIVMNGIARGEQAWLDIVPQLRTGTDGETGEGLSMSLQEALSKNAAGLLRLFGSGEDAEGVCGESATETVRPDRAAAIAAVEAVSDPALAQAKAACLTALRATAAQ